MTRSDELRELLTFNRWANVRMLEAAAVLSDEQFTRDLGNSYPSVRDTLVHIMSAEWVWLSRLQGVSPPAMPEQWKPLMLDAINAEWSGIDRSLQAEAGGMGEDQLDESLDYVNTAGQPFSSTRAQILRHVVNHSSYHRGQITTLLRQLGAAPPTTDLIVFYRR